MGFSTTEIILTTTNVTVEEASVLSNSMVTTFGVVQFCGVIFAPMNGIVIDYGTGCFLSIVRLLNMF